MSSKEGTETSLVLLNSSEYFHSLLTSAFSNLKIPTSDNINSYLVSLLENSVHLDNVYPKNGDGQRQETLALLFAEAMEEELAEARKVRLKHIGDHSLYIAGFFTDSIKAKVVDVNYYIHMGGAAYQNVAYLNQDKYQSILFNELSERFGDFVNVLSQVSSDADLNTKDNNALLEAYDLWAKTGSKRLEKQLLRAGISTADGVAIKSKKKQ